MQLMSGRLPRAVGVLTATAAAVVLLAGSVGYTEASRLVTGWRVMVPSSAFGFLCAGLGLIIAASLRANDRISARVALRAVALAMLVLPLATLLEYTTGTRWGVESWLGATIPGASANAYAGRMSAMTSLSFVLLGIALAALTWRGRWAFGAVRVAGGTVLAVSWFAVLAISFDEARINNQPQFPGMAALTIVLFALSSYSVLAASIDVVTRVRDAGTDVALHAGLVVSAFALPLILGPLTEFSTRWLAPELSTALAAMGFAAALTVVVWRGLARMQDLQQQRRAVLAELEERVLVRTGELAHINLQLRQSEERLIEANRHKDEFLAMLSHELRNPLAPIRTGVELLKSPETTAGVRAEVHRVVERQMTHMIRLIDDLLDVSRINAGKLTLHLERLDLRDVVEQAVESTRHIVDRAGHDLRVIMPARAVLVEGDSTRLTQVASNLIQNACKYTPAVDGSRSRSAMRPIASSCASGTTVWGFRRSSCRESSRNSSNWRRSPKTPRVASGLDSLSSAASSRCTAGPSKRQAKARTRAASSPSGCPNLPSPGLACAHQSSTRAPRAPTRDRRRGACSSWTTTRTTPPRWRCCSTSSATKWKWLAMVKSPWHARAASGPT